MFLDWLFSRQASAEPCRPQPSATYPGTENTLLGRCMRAYNEAPGHCLATARGMSLVMEHLAAEIMAQQHMRGAMDAREVARMLLEGAHHPSISREVRHG